MLLIAIENMTLKQKDAVKTEYCVRREDDEKMNTV